jgi:transcriptional regulator with XRE-family HTH domain
MRRRLLHLTQAQVAARCGTTFQQVQKYESGLAAFSVGRLNSIAEALQTSACSLLESALEPTVGMDQPTGEPGKVRASSVRA